MPDITVLTSITGGKDHLRDDQFTEGGRFIAYVSEPHLSKVWEERPAYDRFHSDRRNSRAPKILSHQFCAAEYSIWLDGSVALRIDPVRLIEQWLGDYDFAVFRHPRRECLYDEALTCMDFDLDDPEIIRRQVGKYASEGYAKGQGLAECNVIVRRHTPQVTEFNNTWWAEYCAHSVRDQISFMYAANKVGLCINWITPSASAGHSYFDCIAHLTPQPEPRA